MGSVENLEDKSPITASPSTPLLSLQSSFKRSYVSTLLPALNNIRRQGASITLNQRLIAVKYAANMSLALSASGNASWSQALMKKLMLNMPPGKALSRSEAKKKPWNARVSKSRNQWSLNRLRRVRRRRALGKRQLVSRRHSSYVEVLRNARSSAEPCASKDMGHCADGLRRVSMEQIKTLGGLVPGGHCMDTPLLLQEAADYILSLQMQVEALQSLAQLASCNTL